MVHNRIKSRESGQIMLLLALSVVALMGFAALAIDVGLVYAERRAMQNAADSAVLSAMQVAMQTVGGVGPGNFQCNTNGAWVTSTSGWSAPGWLNASVLNTILQKAQSITLKNGYTIETGLANQNGVAFRCGAENGSSYAEIRVELTHSVETSFLGIFGRGELANTVEAAARGLPSQPGAAGFALYATDTACSTDGGINFKGGGNANPNVDITHGGAYTRSCLHGNNNSHVFIRADTSIQCRKDPLHLTDWCDDVGGTSTKFIPTPQWASSDPLGNLSIDLPDCANRSIAPARTVGGATIDPGYYTSLGSKPQLSLKPGLYCFDFGGELKLNGGAYLNSMAYGSYVEGVTIVLMGNTTITSLGNGNMNLKAAKPKAAGAAPNVVEGVVMMASSATAGLDFSGNAQALLWGTVYMPNSYVGIGGTGDVVTATQFIVHGFDQHGTSTLKLDYDGSWFAQNKPMLQLQK